METPSMLIVVLVLLSVLYSNLILTTHAAEGEEIQPTNVNLIVRNELPEEVALYWEGTLQDEHSPIQQGSVAGKGGESVLKSFPGHRFSYNYGGRNHYIMVPSSTTDFHLEVLLGGRNEITVHCTTTAKGSSVKGQELKMRIIPWWSPVGAANFLDLVRDGHYNGAALNRVVPNFLTQFGISPDYAKRTKMRTMTIRDDPVQDPPVRFHPGSLSYAGSGTNSRTTEVFIVMPGTRQSQLDFFGTNPWETPFGIVDRVQDTVVKDWYSYGDMPPWGKGPNPQNIYRENGYEYLKEEFPLMDYIEECKVKEITAEDATGDEL